MVTSEQAALMPQLRWPQGCCRLGLARRDVTPPPGIYHRMWGAASHDRSTGVHRPLTATALVFAPAGCDEGHVAESAQVVVAVDHCLLWSGEMDALRSTIRQSAGIEPPQLTVAFSHTHAAGLMGWERESFPGGELIRPYLDQLAELMAEAVSEALSNSQPVTLTSAVGRCDLAAQRDFWDEESGQFICGLNPDAPADDALLLTRVTNDQGQIVTTLVNYACHPTTLAYENTLVSPDFPGAMREVIETATGTPCVFLQGASGDLGPREGFVGDPAVADRNGRQLGHAALATLESLPPPGTLYQYRGPVLSGATLGRWDYQPLEGDELAAKSIWRQRHWTVDLPYRPGCPTVAETEQSRSQWEQREDEARKEGDAALSADCRAMVERMDRRLVKITGLSGEAFAFPIAAWQIGDLAFVAVEGEPYNLLQTELRRRHPDRTVTVMALANGSRCSYLPTEETYGRGIYQESIAVLAPGCLEQLIQAIDQQLGEWTTEPIAG